MSISGIIPNMLTVGLGSRYLFSTTSQGDSQHAPDKVIVMPTF